MTDGPATGGRRLLGSVPGPRRPWRTPSAEPPRRHFLSRRLAQLGLRARVTVAFALGALVLSGALSALTYAVTRNFLVQQRERAAVSQAFVNAQVARDVLRAPGPDVPRLLAALGSAGGARGVLLYRQRWFATSLAVGRDTLPLALRRVVAAGVPARQGFRLGAEPWFAVGVPLSAAEASYFEVVPVGQLERTLDTLGLSLLGAGVVTTAAGVAMGRWLSNRLLRPLADVSDAAAAIAGGELGTRLDAPDDRDLAPLASSFNAMVDALAERIAREARFVSDVSHELRSPLTT
ncbi:MAG: HAMP domain-containing protein, partial [Acidimicrobiia bacterium]